MIRYVHKTVNCRIYEIDNEIQKLEVLGWELISTMLISAHMYETPVILFFKKLADDD